MEMKMSPHMQGLHQRVVLSVWASCCSTLLIAPCRRAAQPSKAFLTQADAERLQCT